MIKFAEIRTDYVDESEGRADCYVDTWRTGDDDEEGHSVAYVDLYNGQVTWLDTNTDIIGNPQIILAIASILKKYNLD